MSTWFQISGRAGRNDYPYLLVNAVLMDQTLTDEDEIAEAIESAWTAAEYPENAVSQTVWQVLFGVTGFIDGGVRADNPVTGTITLYRGAIDKRKAGMSWTTSVEKAQWFAGRFMGLDRQPRGLSAFHGTKKDAVGRVWQITVNADAILAHFNGRGEDEWVLAMDDELAESIIPYPVSGD